MTINYLFKYFKRIKCPCHLLPCMSTFCVFIISTINRWHLRTKSKTFFHDWFIIDRQSVHSVWGIISTNTGSFDFFVNGEAPGDHTRFATYVRSPIMILQRWHIHKFGQIWEISSGIRQIIAYESHPWNILF